MKNLTNKELADLQEKYIFYCNRYKEDVYYAGFKPPHVSVELEKESELVLKLIDYTIDRKAADKKRRRKRD